MAIDFGIGLRTLQALGEEASRDQQMTLNAQEGRIRQQQADQRAYVFGQQQQQDQARPGLIAQARRGDYTGAQDQALGGGDFDLAKVIGGLRQDQLEQFQHQADVVGNLVPRLKALPPEQRAAAGSAVLAQAGFTPQQLQAMDWSDDGLALQYELSAAGKAALAARTKAAEPYTLNAGDRRYSGSQMIAENPKPDNPDYIWDSESGNFYLKPGSGSVGAQVIPGGGGIATGGGGPSSSGRTQFGWTPRARNGGDNTDAAVDGKIAGMSRFLRLDPAAPFPTSMTDIQIARALTLSEGGAGSLADRNNNPGNLTDPRTGAYRKFATKEDGLQAAAAQVRRNRARGQNSISAMVEGLPVGGRGAPQTQPGVINVRAPKARNGNAPSGYRFAADGTTLEAIPGGPADPTTATGRNVENNRKAEANYRKEFDGLPEVKQFKTARQQFQSLRALALNPKATAQDDIATIFSFMKTLDPNSTVREGEFATAQNAGGIPDTIRNAFNKAQNGERLNPEQRQNMVRSAYQSYKSFRDAYNTTAENYRGYARDNGINPDRVARTYTPDAPRPSAQRKVALGQSSTINGFKVTRVR